MSQLVLIDLDSIFNESEVKRIAVMFARDRENIPHGFNMYWYRYLNSTVECYSCKAKIGYQHILRPVKKYAGKKDVCPLCKSVDSFFYELEAIDKALIRLMALRAGV